MNAPAPAAPPAPRSVLFAVAIAAAVLLWSGVAPVQRNVWLLEVSPALAGALAMALRWPRFPFTPLTVWACAAFFVVICVGAHYTYAEVPLGFWVSDAFGLERNHYDRLGHLLQGIIPALLGRELLLRCTGLVRGKALFWVAVSIALAVSATYEILEWWSALVVDPEAGQAFLGSQGDSWDAQWDMTLAASGAVLAQLLLARVHDRQLAELPQSSPFSRR